MRVADSGEQGLWGAHREDRRPIALRRYLGDAANEEVYCELRYQGQLYDAETGLYYNRHRYYDAESGQYISPDPIGLLGGIRPQGYVHNPLEWVDPLGLTGKNTSESVDLYRAVGPDELADIQSTGKFNSPYGIETKYFTTSGEKASEYAKKAVSAFGDEPYTIIKTAVPKDMLKNPFYFAEVDGGIPAYVLPNKVLENVSPNILNYSPIPR